MKASRPESNIQSKKRNSPKKGNDSEKTSVILKNLGPFTPRQYVPFFYIAVFLLFFFGLAFLPGILHHGSWLTVESQPAGAAVFLDGQYLGATPLRVWRESGAELSLEVSKPGYLAHRETIEIPGRIFLSLLFPAKINNSLELDLSDLTELENFYGVEFRQWGLRSYNPFYPPQGPADDVDFVPPLWTQLSQDSQVLGEDWFRTMVLRHWPDVKSSHLYTELRNILFAEEPRANLEEEWALWENYLGEDYLEDRPFFLYWLANNAFGESSWWNNDFATSRITSLRQTLERALEQNNNARPSLEVRQFQGQDHIGVPGGLGILGYSDTEQDSVGYSRFPYAFPRFPEIDSFLIRATPISNNEYKDFVIANPFWAPSRRNSLVEAGLVDDQYLNHWIGDEPRADQGDKALHSLSWFAAQAFLEWFNNEQNSNYTLPTENQWEWFLRYPGRETLVPSLTQDNLSWIWTQNALRAYDHAQQEWGSEETPLSDPGLPGMNVVMRNGLTLLGEAQILRGYQNRLQCSPLLGLVLISPLGNL